MKKLKRVLSSILAFVMVFSMITVMNVSNVFAGELTGLTTVSNAAEAVFGTTIQAAQDAYDTVWMPKNKDDTGVDDNNIKIEASSAAGAGTKSNGTMFGNANLNYSTGLKDATITITPKKAGRIVLDFAGGGSKHPVSVTHGTDTCTVGNTGADSNGIQAYFDVEAEDTVSYVFQKTDGKNFYTYAVGFVADPDKSLLLLDSKELNLYAGDEAKITATVANVDSPNITFKSDNEKVHVTNEGAVTVDSDATGTATITATESTKNLTAECNVTILSVTNESKVWKFDKDVKAGDLENGLSANVDMKYTEGEGYNSFVQGSENAVASGNEVTGSAFKIRTAVDGKLIVRYKANANKTVHISKVSGDTLEDVLSKDTPAGYEAVSVNLEKGNTYYIYALSGTKICVNSIEFIKDADPIIQEGDTSKVAVYDATKGTFYAISVVPQAEAAKHDSVAKQAGENIFDSSNTVYTSVQIGGNTYTAEQLGGSKGDYVHATKIDEAYAIDIYSKIIGITTVFDTPATITE